MCCAPQNVEGVKYYRKPFEFLSLGIMAYVGNDRALTQVRRASFAACAHSVATLTDAAGCLRTVLQSTMVVATAC